MSDSVQVYQKLLTDAIHKQMIILGPQITLLKTRNIPSLTVTEDGTVISVGDKPVETVRRFLEEFRELSAPLVKKTMQPVLSTLAPGILTENHMQTSAAINSKPSQTENINQGPIPNT